MNSPMTTPSIREALIHTLASLAASISLLERTPRAKKAAPSDKMFDQMIADYKAALEQGRAALAALPQDVVEGIARIIDPDAFNDLNLMDDLTTSERHYIKINQPAKRATAIAKATAILASGLVTVTHPDEAAIRAGGAK